MSWEKAEEQSKKYLSGGEKVILGDDGAKVTGVFQGEPVVVWQHFINNTFVKCIGKENGCEECLKGDNPTLRNIINFWDMEAQKIKMFEMSATTFTSLLEMRARFGLDKQIFEINRRGSKGSSKTNYVFIPVREANNTEMDIIMHADLFDLKEIYELSF